MAPEKEKTEKKEKVEKKVKKKSPKTPKAQKDKPLTAVKEFSSKTILLEPITTEKIVRQIELENKIAFIVNRRATKEQIKEEIEATFKSKVESVNTHIRNNKKIAFIKLKQDSPAIDIATKLGII
jgi:large subunit ribosomal protein L23